jgi:hypothetical protein
VDRSAATVVLHRHSADEIVILATVGAGCCDFGAENHWNRHPRSPVRCHEPVRHEDTLGRKVFAIKGDQPRAWDAVRAGGSGVSAMPGYGVWQ